MSTRVVIAVVLVLGALIAAIVLLSNDVGPFAGPAYAVASPTATELDTMAVRGRRVIASVEGTVEAVDADEVWLSMGDDAFPLRLPEGHGLGVEDRVMAVGRLRARRGQRWLAVDDWALVVSVAAPPPFVSDTLGAGGAPADPPPEAGL